MSNHFQITLHFARVMSNGTRALKQISLAVALYIF